LRPRGLDAAGLPGPIRDVAARLQEAGHAIWLVGEGLCALLCDETPVAWVWATNASPRALAEALPGAVQTRSGGTAFTTPTAAGPVDLHPLRWGDTVEADLAHAGFTRHAMAWSFPEARLIDPHGGRANLEAGRLVAVGRPEQALAESPLRSLVAARLIAERPLSLDPDLAVALRDAPVEALAAVPAAALRREVSALLQAPGAGRGVALLRETGAERAFGLHTDHGAARRVDAMPRDLDARLLAWTAGHGGTRVLGRLRFDPDCRRRLGQLIQYHPVEQRMAGMRATSLRRALRRLPDGAFTALADLRAAQLEDADVEGSVEAASVALTKLREQVRAIEEESRQAEAETVLLWQGRDVIVALDIEPGPLVGAALRYLRAEVAKDASLNEPEALRGLLLAWHAERIPGSTESAS
jgi:tRNA nucleotidyltransferase/poly(A) polymerase